MGTTRNPIYIVLPFTYTQNGSVEFNFLVLEEEQFCENFISEEGVESVEPKSVLSIL